MCRLLNSNGLIKQWGIGTVNPMPGGGGQFTMDITTPTSYSNNNYNIQISPFCESGEVNDRYYILYAIRQTSVNNKFTVKGIGYNVGQTISEFAWFTKGY